MAGRKAKYGSRINDTVYRDPDHVERREKRYERDYGFTKGKPPRSSANSEWEHTAILEQNELTDENKYNSPREVAMVSGAVANFGHRGKQIDGGHRLSGNPKAHRLGKR